ncbi:PIG-L family deacetylase [Rugamonas sp. A1-17]|nr:PIG-L family deacetylase [Rugamonas sp. A1-17]
MNLLNYAKRIFSALFLVALTGANANAAVYFVAHPDDLELLMGGNAITDIIGNYPTVIVVVTAGDAHNLNRACAPLTISWTCPDKVTDLDEYNVKKNPYYRVRLDAHEAAIKQWVPSSYQKQIVRSVESFGSGASAVNVEKASIGNVVMYYLNLPDTQLEKFHHDGNPLFDVESKNLYTPSSLRETMREIISRNNSGTPFFGVNFPEYDPDYFEAGYNEENFTITDVTDPRVGQVIKPAKYFIDHGDHTAVGKFMKDAIQEDSRFWCVGQVIYMGYANAAYPKSLTHNIEVLQTTGYDALNQVLVDEGNWTHNSDSNSSLAGAMDGFHKSYLGKQKFRLYGIPGAGACTF